MKIFKMMINKMHINTKKEIKFKRRLEEKKDKQ